MHVDGEGNILAIREDVGRHIALDKLVGHLQRSGRRDGAILVTSRASFEMVQKCASAGVEILLAISAATELAVERAEQTGLTLVGFCRPGGPRSTAVASASCWQAQRHTPFRQRAEGTRPLALGIGSGIVLRQQDRFGRAPCPSGRRGHSVKGYQAHEIQPAAG